MNIVEYFELEKVSKYILENDFKKVCLQFPDNLLPHAVQVSEYLSLKCARKVYILADTSYGSCCVDKVAAQHIESDCLVHFGPSCHSNLDSDGFPVMYVFGKKIIDEELVAREFAEYINEKNKEKVVLFFDAAYSHAMKNLASCLPGCVIVSEFSATDNQIMNRKVDLSQREDILVLYVGPESIDASNLMMYFNGYDFILHDPETKKTIKNCSESRTLSRRVRYIEEAKKAKRIGILSGTLVVEHNLLAVEKLKSLISKAGKQWYHFVVGKLTMPKLCNFQEIDIFVIIGCPQNSMLDSREFYRPIILPSELEWALEDRQWDGSFTNSLNDFVKDFEPLDSMGSQLEKKSRKTHVIEYEAANVLNERHYKGLTKEVEKLSLDIVEGFSGVARGYTKEK